MSDDEFGGGVVSNQLDAVARQAVEAVAEAMEAFDAKDHVVGWDCFAEEMIVDWTGLAEAAVQAIGLTQEVSVRVGEVSGCVMSAAEAARDPNIDEIIATRWISPWVRVEQP